MKNNLISQQDYDTFQSILICPHDISYNILKGHGLAKGQRRADAICTGLIQATLEGQGKKSLTMLDNTIDTIPKPYSDDWTTDGFIRWAISTGLIKYDYDSDSCNITELGTDLVRAIDSGNRAAEKEYLTDALLQYPLCTRILDLLSDDNYYTKFELGSQIGFENELGFTSVSQDRYIIDYNEQETDDDKKKIRSNTEGDSDKYVRTICNWLTKMNWIETGKKIIRTSYRGNNYVIENQQAYRITNLGHRILTLSNGNSSHARIPKIIFNEMLATKTPDAAYLRKRRAVIINALTTKGGYKSLDSIRKSLAAYGLSGESDTAICDDIDGLKRIGMTILENSEHQYKSPDTILELRDPVNEENGNADISEMKDRTKSNLKMLDHKYLILFDYAYSDKARKGADARNFEILTADLFSDLGFESQRLGDSNKPDVIISYNKDGTIIDNKSYCNGFSVDKHCSDEIRRYIDENAHRTPSVPINEWWKNFNPAATDFTYLFVTSYLKGNFQNNLRELSSLSGISGGAIGTENLLYIADDIKTGVMKRETFFSLMNNDEIVAAAR